MNMKSLKLPVILFFVDGSAPSPEDYYEASQLGGEIRFRNARVVDPDEIEGLEICEGVAGKVPVNYKNKYPSAEKAVAKYRNSLEALQAKVGDKKAPDLQTATPSGTKEGEGAPNSPAWKSN